MDKRSAVVINGKSVSIEWTRSAERALVDRSRPLVVELELYFSCLVKKFVRFHDEPAGRAAVGVGDKLMLCFRSVTSTACTMEVAERLGRQPETELDTAASKQFAPKRVRLNFRGGRWQGEFWM
ncbi:MAG: hypothetical protein HZC37_13960 [Burkholderiales bacterium]|nr:hypothetical protein [Burkholderiales bacterium]